MTRAAISVAAHPPCRLLYVNVDTGAQVSVLPPSCTDRLRPQDDFKLAAVNGSAIATYGKRSLTLNLGLRRTFRWIFIIANVRNPILGADFLQHFVLLVDLQRSQLVDSHTHKSCTVPPCSGFLSYPISTDACQLRQLQRIASWLSLANAK